MFLYSLQRGHYNEKRELSFLWTQMDQKFAGVTYTMPKLW